MKFILYRDPQNRNQKIPFPAMEISGLANTDELMIHADAGCILISRNDLSASEALKTIANLRATINCLRELLVNVSNEVSNGLDIQDPLFVVDEDVLEDLLKCGANPDGLRLLLALEEEDNAE